MRVTVFLMISVYLFSLAGCNSYQNPRKLGSHMHGEVESIRPSRFMPVFFQSKISFWRRLLEEDAPNTEDIIDMKTPEKVEDKTKLEKEGEKAEEKREGKDEPAAVTQKEEVNIDESKRMVVKNEEVKEVMEVKNEGVEKEVEVKNEAAVEKKVEVENEGVEKEVEVKNEAVEKKVEVENEGVEKVGIVTNQSKETQTEEQAHKEARTDVTPRVPEQEQKEEPKIEEVTDRSPEKITDELKDQSQVKDLIVEEPEKEPTGNKIESPQELTERTELPKKREEQTEQKPKEAHTDFTEVKNEEANQIKVEEDKEKTVEAQNVKLEDRKEEKSDETQKVKLEELKEEKKRETEDQQQGGNIEDDEQKEQKAEIKLETDTMEGKFAEDGKQTDSKEEELIKLETGTVGNEAVGGKKDAGPASVGENENIGNEKIENEKIENVNTENENVNTENDKIEEEKKSHDIQLEEVEEITTKTESQQKEMENTEKQDKLEESDSEHKEEGNGVDNEVIEGVESQLEEIKQLDTIDLDINAEGGTLSTQQRDPSDDEYADIMQEFADLPSKFQDTAEKVADHLRPDLQRWTDTSKVYFNLANQQITESFSPLVGKQYAPFLASMISYTFILLPLIVAIILFEHIRALLSLQKVVLFVNIYLTAYFSTLLLASFIIGVEPMSFFYKNSMSSYLYLQLLQALGFIGYLILQTVNIVNSCSSETIAGKLTALLQWVVAVLVGLHYYVTVFHLAVALKAPRTNWKFYGIYSLAFFILCLFARIKWLKKEYIHAGDGITDKKN